MAVLRDRVKWERKARKSPQRMHAGELTAEEQANVKAALRFLKVRLSIGSVEMAERFGCNEKLIVRAVGPKCRVSAALAIATARLAEANIDDLLAGRWPPKGACAHCGRCGSTS